MSKEQRLVRVHDVRHEIPHVISIDFEPCGMPPITSVDDHVKVVLPPDRSDPRHDDDSVSKPLLRTYTRRRWFEDGRWGIDVLQFGPETGAAAHDGPGTQWSRTVQPGDEVVVRGPGGHWQMPDDLTHLLVVADAVALPAVANTLAVLPRSAVATVILAGGHHDYPLTADERFTVVRVPRNPDGSHDSASVMSTVRELELPDDVHAFVHGEATMVRSVRRHLRLQRNLTKDHVHLSAYWFAGRDADGWRAIKKDFNQSMEAESGD